MAYATRDDLARLGLNAEVLQVVSVAAQDSALAAASDVASGYLQGRYTLPLTSWGDDLRWAVCALAAWDLVAAQIGIDPGTDTHAVLEARVREARQWLRDVARGLVTPPGIVDSTPDAEGEGVYVVTNPKRGW